MMENFFDITSFMNITERTPSIGQVKTGITDWGKRNQTSRATKGITLWLDSHDNNDRVVVSVNVILNLKKTAPEKGVDLSIDIHHYSDFDPIKRRFTKSHPEQYFRIDGNTHPDSVKSMYLSFCEQINALMPDDRYNVPGIKDYIAA